MCFQKLVPRIFSFGGDTLFISSHDEIIDFCSMDKKTVAVTDGVHASIHFYNFAIASVTAGTLCPAAHFVYIKYMKIITTLCKENIKLKSLHNL